MKSDLSQICLLLGSNIAPERNLPLAAEELGRLFHVLRNSNVWETQAIGSDGPNFLNAAMLIQTSQDPFLLKMRVLRPLEQRFGRVRNDNKNAARPIDIDVVVWGEQVLDPNLWHFAHLALPTAEVMPDLRSPESGERLDQAAQRMLLYTSVWLRRDVALPNRLKRRIEQLPYLTLK